MWIAWICGLLSSGTTRVLVNGRPGCALSSSHGLCQEDPLSSLLFILAMEVLHHLFRFATHQGLLSSLGTRGRFHCLSLFVDGVILFLRTVINDIQACSAILDDFGEASGLRINLAKCVILPIRCSPDQHEVICWAARSVRFLADISAYPSAFEIHLLHNSKISWML